MTTLSDTSLKQSISFPEFIVLFALISSLAAFGTDTMLAAFPMIADELKVTDYRQMQWVVNIMMLGLSFGQLVFGPLADSYGRKFSIISGTLLFCVGGVISMFSTSMSMMLVGRFIQGIGLAGPRIASMALVRDRFSGDEMARVMSFIMLVFIIVPMIAPMVGQIVLFAFGWRAIFAMLIILGLIAAVWLKIRQPETLTEDKKRPFRFISIVASCVLILKNPVVLAYSIASGFVLSVLLTYISLAQSIFQDIYQLGDLFPYYFGALAFGLGSASLTNGMLVMRLGARKLALGALFGLVATSVSLIVVALTHQGVPPLAVFMGIGFMMFFCVGLLFGNMNSLAMEPLGKMAGVGAAVVGSLSNIVSVIVAGIVGFLYVNTLTPYLTGVVISALIALVIVFSVQSIETKSQQV